MMRAPASRGAIAPRAPCLLAALLAAFLAAPWVVNDYLLTVLISFSISPIPARPGTS